jgi:hypothetical protein
MKFFNIDCHISVIADINHIFKSFGHTVIDVSVSGHSTVMNKEKQIIILNSGYIIDGCNTITRKIGKDFYETFKDKLAEYDGFICCYPAEFCMLYELFNKPIIIVNCLRYEHPFTRYKENWDELNDCIKSLNSKNLLYWICNNKGDVEYTKYYTNIIGNWIPSLCEYTNTKYNPIYNKYIISNRTNLKPHYLNNNAINLSNISRSGKWFDWNEKSKYKGIIHIPYSNGCMSIFEEYTSNIPLFFPSKEFGKELFHKKIMFNDLTFYRYFNIQEPDDMNCPNSLRNDTILNMWFDTCDFYDEENMPYLYYFNSIDHLNILLTTLTIEDLIITSKKMEEFNKKRKEYVYSEWTKILNTIK